MIGHFVDDLDWVEIEIVTYVINEAARVNQKRATRVKKPVKAAAMRMQGARIAVKKPKTLKMRARR